jgi:hypothetical protein
LERYIKKRTLKLPFSKLLEVMLLSMIKYGVISNKSSIKPSDVRLNDKKVSKVRYSQDIRNRSNHGIKKVIWNGHGYRQSH